MEPEISQSTTTEPDRKQRSGLVLLIPRNNETISLVVLVFVVLVFWITTDGLLLSPRTLNVMATFGPEILIITVASGLVLVSGEIDLSVGSIYIVSSVVLGHLFADLGLSLWLAVVGALVAGTLMGAVNGLLVVGTGISSFIITLGTMWAFRGLMLVLIGPTTIAAYDDPDSLTIFDVIASRTWGVPHQAFWLLVLAGVLAFVYTKMPFGIRIRAVGSNERAARMMGIPTKKVKVQMFALGGTLCGLAGVIQVAQSSQAVPQSGDEVMLTALAGAIIGGVALTGGRGGVLGPLIGGVTLLVISFGFIMMGVIEFWTNILVALAVVLTGYLFHRLENLRVRRSV